jgi:FixJ family two-component response regulator
MTRAASSTSVDDHFVIVVDDDVNVRRLFNDALAAAGMRVHATASAEDALRQADAYRDACLVLADVRMPGMDGWDLERELRRLSPRLPVVLVTADRLLSIRGTVRDKPVSADDIAAMVRTSCAHADRPDQPGR